MADVNIEQESKKVAEFGMAGQGCAIWDEIKGMDNSTIWKVIGGAQKQSPNAMANELRVLPAISTESWGGVSKLDSTVDYVGADGQATNILSVHNNYSADLHTCKNLR